MPAFRFHAKTVFLTYAQVNGAFTHQQLFDHVKALRGEDPVCLRVGEESHADGGTHYHVFGKWSRKVDTIDPRYFDFNDIHPNIQSARNEGQVYTYCGKDGVVLDFGIPPKCKRGYGDIIKDATTEAEFFEQCAEVFPRDYVLNHEKLEYFARKKYKRENPPYVDPYNGLFNVPNVLDDWVANNLQADNIGMSYPRSASLLGAPVLFRAYGSTTAWSFFFSPPAPASGGAVSSLVESWGLCFSLFLTSFS